MTNAVSARTIHHWLDEKSCIENNDGSVLFHAGSGVFQRPGGGEIQLIKTGEALEHRGLKIGLFNPWRDKLANHRLIHFFGLHPEAESLARLAKSAGIGVVVSPICWYDPLAQWHEASGWIPELAGLSKWFLLRHCRPARSRAWRSRLLALADRILPNSEAEAEQLVQLLGVDRARVAVVPNAVDAHPELIDPELAERHFGLSEFVLYVGRIEPRKNVLGLIEATTAAGLPLVVIGQCPLEFAGYELQCRRAANRGQVIFAGGLAKNDPLLGSALASARVFALPSWFETPGLAALEAASFETPVVITSRGATREYFSDSVVYCDPARPRSVRNAIELAWNQPPAGRLQLAGKIKEKYNWSEVARITEGIYDAVT